MQSVDTMQELEALESRAARGESLTYGEVGRMFELSERARFISRVPEAPLSEYRKLRAIWRDNIQRHNSKQGVG